MKEFKIGDRVRLVSPDMEDLSGGLSIGDEGVVVDVLRDEAIDVLGVYWDKRSENKHGCSGLCPYGHGYYTSMDNVVLVEEQG